MLLGLGRQPVQAKLLFKIKRFWIPGLRAAHQLYIIDLFWLLQLTNCERLRSKKFYKKYYNKMNTYGCEIAFDFSLFSFGSIEYRNI